MEEDLYQQQLALDQSLKQNVADIDISFCSALNFKIEQNSPQPLYKRMLIIQLVIALIKSIKNIPGYFKNLFLRKKESPIEAG